MTDDIDLRFDMETDSLGNVSIGIVDGNGNTYLISTDHPPIKSKLVAASPKMFVAWGLLSASILKNGVVCDQLERDPLIRASVKLMTEAMVEATGREFRASDYE